VTPVKQSKLYTPDAPQRGNCLTACLASLLDIPLWMVPAFEDMRGDLYQARIEEWLSRLFGVRFVDSRDRKVDVLPEYYIANGPSPRGVHHSVIYRAGELVHDPHPIGGGIAAVEWTWHLEGM